MAGVPRERASPRPPPALLTAEKSGDSQGTLGDDFLLSGESEGEGPPPPPAAARRAANQGGSSMAKAAKSPKAGSKKR